MKSLFKKIHKGLTVVMCLALAFETINLTSISAFAADGENVVAVSGNDVVADDVSSNDIAGDVPVNTPVTEDVSGNDVLGNQENGNDISGNDAPEEIVKTQTELFEEQLAGIGKNAADRIADKASPITSAVNSANAALDDVKEGSETIKTAEKMDYNLLRELESMQKSAADIPVAKEKAEKAYGNVSYILTSSVENFEKTLAKLQGKDAAVTGNDGNDLLTQAGETVENLKAQTDSIVKIGEEANALVAEAQVVFATKPVVAYFFVLNRGLEIPENIFGLQRDYSTGTTGELYSGAIVEGSSDYSYLTIYENEEIIENVYSYIKTEPTREAINEVLALQGDALAEGEEIRWYGIKTIGGIIHVDGMIVEKDVTDNGNTNPDGGNTNPDNGNTNPDGGNTNPDNGNTNPDGGNTNPDNGNTTPGENTNPDNGNTTPGGNAPVNNQENNGNNAPVVIEGDNGATTETETEPVAGENEEVNVIDEVVPVEPVEEDEEQGEIIETVEVEEEEVPLASELPKEDDATDAADDIVVIEDEETPLASMHSCGVHWAVLILTALYTLFELIRCINRNKRINELKGETENVTV